MVSYLALIRSPGVGRTIILFIAVPIAIIAYAADVADRLDWVNLSNRGELLLGWGRHDDTFFEIINSPLLSDDKGTFHVLLILNVAYSDIDRMTDDGYSYRNKHRLYNHRKSPIHCTHITPP